VHIQAASRKVARNVLNAVSKLTDMVSQQLKVGDPPVNIHLRKMTLHVKKNTADAVARQEVRSHIGSTRIRGELDVVPGACVLSRVRSIRR